MRVRSAASGAKRTVPEVAGVAGTVVGMKVIGAGFPVVRSAPSSVAVADLNQVARSFPWLSAWKRRIPSQFAAGLSFGPAGMIPLAIDLPGVVGSGAKRDRSRPVGLGEVSRKAASAGLEVAATVLSSANAPAEVCKATSGRFGSFGGSRLGRGGRCMTGTDPDTTARPALRSWVWIISRNANGAPDGRRPGGRRANPAARAASR